MTVAIKPFTCLTKNLKTGQPYVAVSFTVNYQMRLGAMVGATPYFFDSTGAVLPNGTVPLLPVAGQSPAELQSAESTDIARACAATPTASVDVAAGPIVVTSRGVTLA